MLSLQGVQDNCFFFKSIADATSIRQRICESFERAALPGISDEVRSPDSCPYFCSISLHPGNAGQDSRDTGQACSPVDLPDAACNYVQLGFYTLTRV